MWADTESENDYLNFGEVSKLAVDILKTPSMLPVSIGVFGNWGSGKSSLLKLIQKQLAEEDVDHIPVYFDAWLYQGYDDARSAFLEVIARELVKASRKDAALLKKAESILKRVDIFRIMGFLAEGLALAQGVPTGGLLARSVSSAKQVWDELLGIDPLSQKEYQEATATVIEGKDTLSRIAKDISPSTPPQQIDAFRQEFGELLEGLKKPLIVIIDNLDRCLPANAIQTLEAIRLFLFLPKTAFIIAADEEMIRSAVAEHFKGTSNRHQIDYLDKLIQVPIRVPKSGVREIRSYLFMLFAIEHGLNKSTLDTLRITLEESLQQSWQKEPISRDEALSAIDASNNEELTRAFELADRIAPILAKSPMIHGNPRIVKRLLNLVKMRVGTANRRGMPLDEGIITKLVIFERCAGTDATSALYQLIDVENGEPEILRELESHTVVKLPDSAPQSWKQSNMPEFILEWSKLHPTLANLNLRPALYLSRETMPLGVYVVGLSPQGREALQALSRTKSTTSPTGKKAVESIPAEEQILVMEGLINHLRQISDISKQPDGFSGACLLASKSSEAAKLLRRFIDSVPTKPPWMNARVLSEDWYKEA